MALFDVPMWLTLSNLLLGVFAFAILVAGAWVVILARKKTETGALQIERATTAEGLVKLRDVTITELQAKYDKLEDELEAVTAEHRTLVGFNIEEMLEFWGQKDQMEADMADLKRQIRVLKLRKDHDI